MISAAARRCPTTEIMRFDSADVAQMAANGTLTAVIMHEMGHVLGLGTLWQNLGLRNGYNYTGAHALAEYRALTGNPNATSIPLETNGVRHGRQPLVGSGFSMPS